MTDKSLDSNKLACSVCPTVKTGHTEGSPALRHVCGALVSLCSEAAEQKTKFDHRGLSFHLLLGTDRALSSLSIFIFIIVKGMAV